MSAEAKPKLTSLYDIDFQCWIDQTVEQLKTHDFGSLDLENLIEEIESLGKLDKRAVSSYLRRLCEHLLKIECWELERETCFRGWRIEVQNFRLQIRDILKDNPGLKNYLKSNFAEEYRDGRKLLLNSSNLDPSFVPEAPAFTLEQALDEDWLPWRPSNR
ncbi:MAG: DUF29 domain-containing protein [Cyanobacteria bacterium J06626_23]